MQIIYAFIYYTVIVLLALVASLGIFVFPPVRRLLHRFQSTYRHLFENQLIKYGIYLSFAIIAMILIESIWTYSTLTAHFSRKSRRSVKEVGLQSLDMISAQNSESYLQLLREYKEYYLSQRNIMLACSALFIYFVLQRLFYNIRKYAELEHQIATVQTVQAKLN